MTRIGIVGGGRAATIHAEAVAANPGVELVGVGGRPGTAGRLAAAMGVPDLSLPDLAQRADGLVLAVPAAAMADIVDALPADMPLLIEMPVGAIGAVDPRAMTAVNLLHAPVVKKALRAVTAIGSVHHLQLRGRALRRGPDADLLSEPFAGAWPVLLGAAGVPVVSVAARISDETAQISLDLSDGRTITGTLEWVTDVGAAATDLEAASSTGVVSCRLWPVPMLEIDGRPAESDEDHPLVALGFVEQIRRFAAVCEGRAEAWPALSAGSGVARICAAAHESSRRDGERVGFT